MPVRYLNEKDRNLLGKIREAQPKRVYGREEAIEVWNDVKQGLRKYFPKGFWDDPDHRKYIVREFVDGTLKATGHYPGSVRDWKPAKLGGLLGHYENQDMMAPLKEAGYMDRESENFDERLMTAPWTIMQNSPKGYWEDAGNRINAVRWMVDLCRKRNGRNYPIPKDFKENNLNGLIQHHYHSFFEALEEAGYTDPTQDVFDPVLDYAPWLVLDIMPMGYWNDSENRASATRWLVEMTGKEPEEVTRIDFAEYGLGTILARCSDSPVKAVREAGYRMRSIDMNNVPIGTWQSPSKVRSALMEMAVAEGKRPEELNTNDIKRHHHDGMLRAHGYSPREVLRFAGFDDRTKDGSGRKK
ncbi:MAG: hypothetical protein V1887_04115 [Candidatus Aenigmatarchaeota archaeon]